MAVTTVGPALDVTASRKVISSLFGCVFNVVNPHEACFLVLSVEGGDVGQEVLLLLFSVLLPHCFHIRLFVAFAIVQGFLYLGWQSLGEGLVVKCGSTGGTVWSSPVRGEGCG